MELPSIIKQKALNTRAKIEDHMLIVMDKPIDEEHLSQPLQFNKQFKLAVIFLTGYIGIFNVTTKDNKFYFTVSINDDDSNQKDFPPGAYKIERLTNEIEKYY